MFSYMYVCVCVCVYIYTHTHTHTHTQVLGGSDSKESACNAGDPGLIPESGGCPGEGNPSTPVFLPGEFHGQRSLAGCSQWSHSQT